MKKMAKRASPLIAGAIAVLALPPFNFFPAMFAGLGSLYVLTARAETPVKAFKTGWLFGFGYFVFGLYWIGNALLVDGNEFYWAWPLAVCGLPIILSFFPAFACLLTRRFSDMGGISGLMAFTGYMAFFEWARGHVFTGFPWNLYGHAWAGVLPMLQILSVSDVYSLTLFTIFWCASCGYFFTGEGRRATKRVLAGVVIVSIAGCYGFGAWRLARPLPETSKATIILAQANIQQSEKWDAHKAWEHLEKRIALSTPQAEIKGPVLIVWPETALTQPLLERPEAQAMIKGLLNAYPGPAYLMTGLLRRERDPERYYNSLVMIDKTGKISNVYNKNHLVPFGEYIPYQKWIPLAPVTGFKGFSGGGRAQTFETPEGLKYSPMICYEIIFSGAVADESQRPDFILNVTNDSWYGVSPGPYQHLAQARFRAIEEGLPVVRVADTGISVVIDPYGRNVVASRMNEEYAAGANLPTTTLSIYKDILYKPLIFRLLTLFFIIMGLSPRIHAAITGSTFA